MASTLDGLQPSSDGLHPWRPPLTFFDERNTGGPDAALGLKLDREQVLKSYSN